MKTLALLAAAIVAAPQTGSPPASGGTLTFAWPPGVVAVVETQYQRRAGIDPVPEVASLLMTHRMRVLAHAEGLEIRYDNQRHVTSNGDFGQTARALVFFWTPRTIVSPDGAFLRIEGEDEVRDLVLATIAPNKQLAEAAPQLREWLAPLTDSGFLSGFQRSEWGKLRQWSGLALERMPIATTGSEQMIPGLPIPTKRTIEVIGRSRCARQAIDHDCITIELRVSMDPSALTTFRERVRQATDPSAPATQTLAMEQVERATVETATLLPHEFVVTRTLHEAATINGTRLTTTDFESRRSRFTYDRPE